MIVSPAIIAESAVATVRPGWSDPRAAAAPAISNQRGGHRNSDGFQEHGSEQN